MSIASPSSLLEDVRHLHSPFPLETPVTILGGGIAGLVAAYELEQLGCQVEILEGSNRIGGRVWTRRFGAGADTPYGEFGAMRIPQEHDLVRHYINDLGLGDRVIPFITFLGEPHAWLDLQGHCHQIAALLDRFEAEPLGNRRPVGQCDNLASALVNWLGLMVEVIAPPHLRAAIKKDELCYQLRLMIEQLDLPHLAEHPTWPLRLHALLDSYPQIQDQMPPALAMFLGDVVTETQPSLITLRGGLQQITDRLASRLRGPIYMRHEVRGITVDEYDIKIDIVADGEALSLRRSTVLCTIPFSVLKHLRLSGIDEQKRTVITDACYWPATKVLLLCANPFWMQDGISGGASFSDRGLRQIYYPSHDQQIDSPSVLLASYTIGEDVETVRAMSLERICQDLKRFHPAIADEGMVMDADTMDWERYPWSAGACAVPSGHADVSRSDSFNEAFKHTSTFAAEASRPQGRLFFAGEHCSSKPAWIEGAIESALHSVQGIVHALSERSQR